MMDIIYGGALLIIIAAAGDDVDYGFPGVSCPREDKWSLKIIVDGTALLSELKVPREYMEDIAWSTRGWILQEGLLSQRKNYDYSIWYTNLVQRIVCDGSYLLAVSFRGGFHKLQQKKLRY